MGINILFISGESNSEYYIVTKPTEKEYDRYKPWSTLRSSLLRKDFDAS